MLAVRDKIKVRTANRRRSSKEATETRALSSERRQRAGAGTPDYNPASLAACDALVDEDFDLNPAVLSPSRLGLVRRLCSVFTHRARCHNVAHGNVALLDQIGDYAFCAVLAQFRVHCSTAGRVRIAHDFDDVSVEPLGGLGKPLDLFLVLRRDLGAPDSELHP